MTRMFFVVCFVLSILQSCKYETVEPVMVVNTDSIISYSKTIAPLTTTQCTGTGCHESGSQDGDFTTYDGLKEKAADGSLYTRVVKLKDMPQVGSGYTLTSTERNYYDAWIKQGFLNN